MTKEIVVVEQFNKEHGAATKRVFKSFDNRDLFEDFCIENNIQIIKASFGTTYNDEKHVYLVNFIEHIQVDNAS